MARIMFGFVYIFLLININNAENVDTYTASVVVQQNCDEYIQEWFPNNSSFESAKIEYKKGISGREDIKEIKK